MMTTVLHYAWRGSRRGLSVLFAAFIALQALLFWNMKSLHLFQMPSAIADQFSFALFILSVLMFYSFLIFQSVQIYRQLLKSRVLQAAPVPGSHYVFTPILLLGAGSVVLLLLSWGVSVLFLSTEAADNMRLLFRFFTDMNGVQLALAVLLSIYMLASVCIHIFFAITLAKSVRTAKKWQVLLALATLFLVAFISSWVYDLLAGIGPVFVLNDTIELLNQANATLTMEETTYSLFGTLFDIAVSAMLWFATVHLIEKRVEH